MYVAYGLGIGSEIELPELPVAQNGLDVRIRRAPVEPVPKPDTGAPLWFAADAQSTRITYPPVGSLLVRSGEEIVIDPIPGAEEGLVRQVILGPALAILLTQRGLTTLHASAVQIAGGGVIFVAGAGAGKSTTAAALHARGHPLVADDAVAVGGSPGNPVLLPGFPRLKLWPSAAERVGIPEDELTVLYQDFDKRGWHVPDGFAPEPVPPTHIYVLVEGDSIAIEPISPADSVLELIRHAHGVMALQGIDPAAQLRRTAAIAESVRTCRLTRPLSLDTLAEVADAVEADVAATRA